MGNGYGREERTTALESAAATELPAPAPEAEAEAEASEVQAAQCSPLRNVVRSKVRALRTSLGTALHCTVLYGT